MKIRTIAVAVAVTVSLATASGCATAPEEEEEEAAQEEDQLILRRGSVDHAAIVESTTMNLVNEIPLDPFVFSGTLDPYNQSDPFAIRASAYAPIIAKNIRKFDASDGKTDWTAAQAATWTARMAGGNYLVVDTSKPCDYANPHTYLEIERAQLTGRAHTTCGGRMPNEDALDVTLNFLARGPASSADDPEALYDGVEQATKKSTDVFPYLAEPNGFF